MKNNINEFINKNKNLIMELTLNKSEFIKRMGIGSQFSGKCKTIPILDCVKIELKKNKISITSTDNDNTIKTYIESFTCNTEDFSFCINARDILNYVKAIRDDNVTFISDDMNTLTIKHSKGMAQYPMIDSDTFPNVDIEKDTINFNTDAYNLCQWITTGRNFVAVDELRPQMCGIYLYLKDNEFGCCATDGNALFTDYIHTEESISDFGFIINKNAIPPLLTLLNNCEDITMRIGSKNVMFICNENKLVARLYDGKYPNFKGVIPKNQPLNVTVDNKSFIDSLQRVSLAGNKTSGLIKLMIDGMNLNVTAQDIDFSTSASEDVMCQSNGEITIGVKADKLLNCLNSVFTSDIILEMSNPTKAITMREDRDTNKILLLMPMLLN